jgi:hypothetical protein
MSKPIEVVCARRMQVRPETIAERLLDLEDWRSFRGWGPLPGVRVARFRRRTEHVVGTQIEVTNLDGSTHVEEIIIWRPATTITMHMSEFSPPLSRFASHFLEKWSFEPLPLGSSGTQVTRRFELHPKHAWGRVVLRLIAPMLRRAVDRHLHDMDTGSPR